jgi:GTP-binding protein HflX
MANPIVKITIKEEKAVLVGAITFRQSEEQVKEYLEELAFLTKTAGAHTLKKFVQKIASPNPRTYIGSGKVAEIAEYVKENEVNVVIFDDELSPSQQRNIEEEVKCKVIDRNSLILDIFAKHAKTSYARTQVELAQYNYLLPRLSGMWTHLSKQKGGIGMKGPGETELETDRRMVRYKISVLKEQLETIDKQKATQRSRREQLVRVALVGYTNVGKSTIMNLLSKSDVLVENKLFATLDTTVRKVVVKNLPFLLSDTVGFIRKLPHHLIESFKSTLDEVSEADVLIHVVDISHPGFEDQLNTVNTTLAELAAADKPTLLIFNKVDVYKFIKKDEDDLTPATKENLSLEDLKNSWMAKANHPSIFISATQRENLDKLRDLIYDFIKDIHVKKYPYNSFLY